MLEGNTEPGDAEDWPLEPELPLEHEYVDDEDRDHEAILALQLIPRGVAVEEDEDDWVQRTTLAMPLGELIALAYIPNRQRNLRILALALGMNWGEAYTHEEIGDMFGLNKGRVGKIRDQVVASIRKAHTNELNDYI